jgi:TonB family protein
MSFEPNLGRGVSTDGWARRIRSSLSALLEPTEPASASDVLAHGVVVQIHDSALLDRIVEQASFALHELRHDPAGFASSLVAPDFGDTRSRRRARALELATLLAGASVIVLFSHLPNPLTSPRSDDAPLLSIASLAPLPAIGNGGGGSGNNAPTPASRGVRPQSSLATPIVPATATPVPQPANPLPVPPPIKAIPLPDNLVQPGAFGDPNGPAGPQSNGEGTGGGIGRGEGGGFLNGVGLGDDDGTDFGRRGGAPGARPPSDREPAPASAPVILNSPRPAYTEAARHEKTQGEVHVRVLFGANGRVKQAHVTRGLPNGLDEKAVEAVYRFDFRPARSALGVPVDAWLTVKVRFTIR